MERHPFKKLIQNMFGVNVSIKMSANQIRSMIFKEISYISSLNLGHVGEKIPPVLFCLKGYSLLKLKGND